MSNVIQFLEAMGGNALMARMPLETYEAMTAELDADGDSREALRVRDESALNKILNARPVMICMVAAPEEAPQEDEAPAQDDDEEKQDE